VSSVADEPITPRTLIAAAIIAGAVLIITTRDIDI
jgi:drug/metabolite transporter (DMT)-like permease